MNKSRISLLLFIIVISICSSVKSQSLYKITRESNKIKIEFTNNWYFTKIAIPVCSQKIWGDTESHNIAILEFENEKHIISSKFGDKYLEYNESTKSTNSLTLTSINQSSEKTEECLPIFKAASSKTKEIEDSILMISQKENDFLLKNQCFSCHRLIPAALVVNTAYKKGFKINESEINRLTEQLSKFQKENGSYYFEKEPVYGKNTTTLSAAFTASLLSDLSLKDFLTIGTKAKAYLNTTHRPNEAIPSDFIFEPFFNNETTSLLFEILFQKYLYLKDNQHHSDSNIRVNQLLKQISSLKDLDYSYKILLLCGIPYSYQVTSNEFYNTINELKGHILSIKSRISSIIGILSLFVLKKISPKDSLAPIIVIKDINFNQDFIIWNCLMEIIYNDPKYLDGNYDEK